MPTDDQSVTDVTDVTDFSVNRSTRARAYTYAYTRDSVNRKMRHTCHTCHIVWKREDRKMAKWPYFTSTWQRLRLAKLAQDPLCEYCGPGRITEAVHVDHRKSISQGGDPWDWDNLASACESCHNSKSRADARGAKWERKGCDKDGRPLDPNHWWRKGDPT